MPPKPPPKTPTEPPPAPLPKSHLPSTHPTEKQFGYHRAVRKGPFIFVSGTAAVIAGTRQIRLKGNARGQAVAAMEECVRAVEALGGTGTGREDVVRVRVYVAGDEHTTPVGRALKAVFGDAEVAATILTIPGGFADPEMLVQVEVDAVVG